MTSPLESVLAYVLLAIAPIVALVLLRISAPYGRHARAGFGPTLAVRPAWVIMESPSLLVLVPVWASGPDPATVEAWILGAAWLLHYGHRTLLYPWTLRSSPERRTPWVVVGSGVAFNCANAYLIGSQLGSGRFPPGWWSTPWFVAGMVLFAIGLSINRWADARLRALRSAGGDGYAIPRGGLFERVSCPNYLGETIEWWGFALASRSLAGLQFAVFTTANLWPRARAHHRFYLERFPDYPRRRGAMLPRIGSTW